jgi:hypothetical protein
LLDSGGAAILACNNDRAFALQIKQGVSMKKYGSGKAGQYAKSEAEKRLNQILMCIAGVIVTAGFILGVGFGYLAFPQVFRFLPWARRIAPAVYGFGFLAIESLALVVFLYLKRIVRRPMDRLHKERVHYLHGGQTEALVAYALRSLDDDWHLFNGVAMKGGGDVDHVLIGPGGLFCLSTKSARGIYAKGQEGKVTLNGKPNTDVVEAQRLAMTLRHWLEARLQPDHGVKSIPYVQPVLIVPFAYVDFPSASMNVWVMDEDEMYDLATEAKTSLRPAIIRGCVKVLQDLTGWDEKSGKIGASKSGLISKIRDSASC